MELFDKFLLVIDAFNQKKVNYILIGGFAVIIHGLPRVTEDVDVFVKMDPANIIKLKEALNSVFQDPSIEEITFDELNKYPVIRYGTPDEFYIDILSKLGELTSYDDLNFEIIEVSGIPVRVATPETLFNLKKDTIRIKDKADAFFLKDIIDKQKKNDHK